MTGLADRVMNTVAVLDTAPSLSVRVFITLSANPVNQPLVCGDVILKTNFNESLSIDINADLLSTCVDPDSTDIIELVNTTPPAVTGSSLTSQGNDTLTYTPATDYAGQDTFSYTATDGTHTDTGTVTVSVAAEDDDDSGNTGTFSLPAVLFLWTWLLIYKSRKGIRTNQVMNDEIC